MTDAEYMIRRIRDYSATGVEDAYDTFSPREDDHLPSVQTLAWDYAGSHAWEDLDVPHRLALSQAWAETYHATASRILADYIARGSADE
jgi:hypothetical protein